ncbi:sugar phosphate nucleotidyltransferase [Patescibacteria group bacterium]
MKGIIIAGGRGSRLYPVTKVINKHLLPVYDKPMIFYPINTLVKAGLKDIIIVSNKDQLDQFKKLLTDVGEFFGVNFNFIKQKEAAGIAHALASCKKIIKDDKVVVVLGDNIITDNIMPGLENFEKQDKGAKVFLKEVSKPERYGVATIEEDEIVSIEEKPFSPKSNYAVTGLYMYDNLVWDIIAGLQPSIRGELEVTDVNNYYLKQGSLSYEILQDDWYDIDTFNLLLEANLGISQNKTK